jgi:hypothetical protein
MLKIKRGALIWASWPFAIGALLMLAAAWEWSLTFTVLRKPAMSFTLSQNF